MSTWPGVLGTLLAGTDLARADAAWAMAQVMDGDATPAQTAAFVVALRAKGESAEEMAGLVATMLERARPVTVPWPVVDTCGTGGDRAHTVNISTMAALVVAGAGHRVVKHGNRAASSACGSADLLEALGVAVDLEPDAVVECVTRAGIAFCFAPVFHPGFRHAALPRREIGVPTVFNFLGPLVNPARPGAQAVGVADRRMAGVMAGVLADRGTSALVFRGEDGLDELTTGGTSHVWWVQDNAVTEVTFDPADLGVARADAGQLRGGDASLNAKVARTVLAGGSGAVRDAVLLNAAAALVAATPGKGDLVEQMRSAYAEAAASVDDGRAADVLARWITTSQDLKPA